MRNLFYLAWFEEMNYNDTVLDKPGKYKHWVNFSWYYANSAISFLKHDNFVSIVFLKDSYFRQYWNFLMGEMLLCLGFLWNREVKVEGRIE